MDWGVNYLNLHKICETKKNIQLDRLTRKIKDEMVQSEAIRCMHFITMAE